MIIRKRPGFLRLFFVLHGSILPAIAPQLIAILVLSTALVLAHHFYPRVIPTYNNGTAFMMLGIALSTFLGFRNNACYDRWWEGRKVWGKIISGSRDMIRQSTILCDREADRKTILELTSAFSHSLVDHLKGTSSLPSLIADYPEEFLKAYQASHNRPSFILNHISECLAVLHQQKALSDIQFQMFDKSLTELNENQTSCERLNNTRVPFAYTLLLHRTAYIYCFLIPFGFTDILGWWTPVASLLVAYTLFGLDALSDELEQPFSNIDNVLPMYSMATTIERDVCAAIHLPLPKPVEPVDFILR
ncbi:MULTISPECIES: bestrophin family protein [Bartonella]|uniref:Membrane protein n=1 Tax=Bartonella choladocola TaxID=2750995 RepID=A0A1U9MGG4_9HYPH|nr:MULTISPECIES: bestrophin family ion channel [Bartonella]AQT46799.1 putative membrane protein [Bartonella choladocola]MBH9974186.1 bestrophin [Bartonella choladocola]MBI0013793.1 bestrophin [Bartonella sp. B10834G3]